VLVAALTIAAGVCIYGSALVPFLKAREKVRNVAREIDAAIPAGERLFVVDPEYQPWLFYLRTPFSYADSVAALPSDARLFLVQARDERDALESQRWLRRPREIARFTDYRRKTVVLFAAGET
jgi:hypothetical protein